MNPKNDPRFQFWAELFRAIGKLFKPRYPKKQMRFCTFCQKTTLHEKGRAIGSGPSYWLVYQCTVCQHSITIKEIKK